MTWLEVPTLNLCHVPVQHRSDVCSERAYHGLDESTARLPDLLQVAVDVEQAVLLR